MKNHILFIADLHLDQQQENITALLLQFLKNEALKAEELFILGDLFEVWCGDDDDSPYYQTIKQAIKDYVDAGRKCYIMPGNRDFLLGNRFMKETGAKLLPDPTIIEHNGQKILLTHGDMLCTDDVKHQVYRKIIQHPLLKFISRIVPLSMRKNVAIKLRQASRKHFLRNNNQLRDVTKNAVNKIFSDNAIDVVVHGHTHVPGIHQHGNKQRYVLGAWHQTGHAWRLGEDFEEITIA